MWTSAKRAAAIAGSTNVLRVMGKKAGLIVFLGDAGKMIVACLLTRLLFRSQPELLYVYLLHRIWRDPGDIIPVLHGI